MDVHILSPSPSPAVDFHFDSASTSPYATAPSSPQSTIPFTWEHKPGIPKHHSHTNSEDEDFAFVYLQRHSISAAEDLFDSGKIKPLKPPPRLHFPNDSPKSSKSPKSRYKLKDDFDPFSEAFKQTSCDDQTQLENPSVRGRERMTKNTRHKPSRSLSPFRVSDIVNNMKNAPDEGLTLTWYNKWKLKNLLLFRSASEGSVTRSKDSLKKYTMLDKNESFSFRSTGNSGLTDEIKEDEMRKKATYKFGLMGCLRFHQNAGKVMKQ